MDVLYTEKKKRALSSILDFSESSDKINISEIHLFSSPVRDLFSEMSVLDLLEQKNYLNFFVHP